MGGEARPADTAGMENTHTSRTDVFLVEDSKDIRTRLAAMLVAIAGVAIVGEADTPAAAIEGILRTLPHSVVLDIQLLGGTGIEVLRKIHPIKPDIVFIVITNHPNPQYRKIYAEAGANYFLDKTTEFQKVKEVVAGLGRAH